MNAINKTEVITDKLGITQPAVSKLESDQTKLSWDYAVKLGELFEVAPSCFFETVVNNFNNHAYLSMNLMKPTCANIRNEFRLMYNAGCDETDRRMIKEFLKLPYDKELSDVSIKKCDTDQFKALCNFLQRNIKSHERNIELLAWLINFPKRPFSKYWRIKNGKPDLLSEISINESGIVTDTKCEALYDKVQLTEHRKVYANESSVLLQQELEREVEVAEFYTNKSTSRFLQKEITLEYPSGVKLSVDASDLGLIAKLIKL